MAIPFYRHFYTLLTLLLRKKQRNNRTESIIKSRSEVRWWNSGGALVLPSQLTASVTSMELIHTTQGRFQHQCKRGTW